MSILTDLVAVCRSQRLPVATSIYLDSPAPPRYAVITPLTETYTLWGDNQPGVNIEEARLNLYIRGDFTPDAAALTKACREHGLTVTARTYVGFETDTGYHHWAIDLADYRQEP